MQLDVQAYGGGALDTGAQAVTSTSSYTALGGPIILGGGKKSALLELVIGAGGAIAHLKFTRAATVGGTHRIWLEDTDFNTATDELIDCVVAGASPPNAYQLAANGVAQFKLDELDGIAEIQVWVKAASTATTAQMTGLVV
jgi:hypothetical protein